MTHLRNNKTEGILYDSMDHIYISFSFLGAKELGMF